MSMRWGLCLYLASLAERVQAKRLLRASEKLAMVDQLASSIAHEIMNPLDLVLKLLFLVKGFETL